VSAGRLRLRGDDLPRSSSGGLLKRPPMGSGSRVTPWDSRRGPALACAQGTTSAGHLARRRAGGGRDASWRMRVAAVTCCEADDRVVHSAALRAATPRPRRPTTTRRRPTAVSTGARRRHNGASVSRIAYRVSPRDPACAGGAPRATARALTENAACACGVRSIGRVDTTGCASSAGPTTAGVQLIRCVNRALRNSGTSPDVSRRREADTDWTTPTGSTQWTSGVTTLAVNALTTSGASDARSAFTGRQSRAPQPGPAHRPWVLGTVIHDSCPACIAPPPIRVPSQSSP